jgi:hypothetical protein
LQSQARSHLSISKAYHSKNKTAMGNEQGVELNSHSSNFQSLGPKSSSSTNVGPTSSPVTPMIPLSHSQYESGSPASPLQVNVFSNISWKDFESEVVQLVTEENFIASGTYGSTFSIHINSQP